MFCIKSGMRVAANEKNKNKEKIKLKKKKRSLIPYCWQSQLGVSLFQDSYIKNWAFDMDVQTNSFCWLT